MTMSNIEKLANNDNKSCQITAQTITSLMHSQGFYGRLYRAINDMSDEGFNAFVDELKEKNFKDTMDVVFYFEV